MRSTDDRAAARRFGLGALGVLALLASWLWLRRHHPLAGIAVGGAGAVLGALGFVWPAAALSLRRVWMGFARALGRVNATILLTVIFFVVLTPVSAARRLFRGRRGRGWEPHEPRARDHFDHPY